MKRNTVLLVLFLIVLFTNSSFALKLPEISKEELEKEQEIQKKLAKKALHPWESKHVVQTRFSSDYKKVLSTTYKILVSAVELFLSEKLKKEDLACGIGFYLEKVRVGKEPYFRPLVENNYIKPEQIGFVVKYVIPGSYAEKAGIKVGDVITEIDGKDVLNWSGENLRTFEREYKLDSIIKKIYTSSDKPHKITVLRISNETKNGYEKKEIIFSPDKMFNLALRYLTDNETINAWTNGKEMYVTKSLVDFLEDEDLLASVIAHETGHALLKHPESTKKRAIAGSPIRLGGFPLFYFAMFF